MPVALPTEEAEVGRSLEPSGFRLQYAMIVPVHCRLGGRVRLSRKQ